MANLFDIGLLREFSVIFSWTLIFAVSFGILQAVDIFKSRGINALIAISLTILLGLTSNASNVVANMLPWFVIMGFFIVFLLIFARLLGIDFKNTAFGGGSGIWWVAVPLVIGLVMSLVSGGVLQRADAGEELTPGKTFIAVLTEPKVLGFFLVLIIAGITVAVMGGVPKAAS